MEIELLVRFEHITFLLEADRGNMDFLKAEILRLGQLLVRLTKLINLPYRSKRRRVPKPSTRQNLSKKPEVRMKQTRM